VLPKPASPRGLQLLDDDEPTVFVVAADPQVKRPVDAAIRSRHLRLQFHATTRSFFQSCDPKQPGCLIWASPGAVNYLEKPLSPRALGEAITEALACDVQRRARMRRAARIRGRLAQLTTGETEVLRMLLDGSSNRQIADLLRLSVRTIEVRRAKLMKKMKARSLPDLVRLVLFAESNG